MTALHHSMVQLRHMRLRGDKLAPIRAIITKKGFHALPGQAQPQELGCITHIQPHCCFLHPSAVTVTFFRHMCLVYTIMNRYILHAPSYVFQHRHTHMQNQAHTSKPPLSCSFAAQSSTSFITILSYQSHILWPS
jgi:hypothetical protein